MGTGLRKTSISAVVIFTLFLQPLVGQTNGGIRDVEASERSLIPLQTRLRYTTMIVLPESEEILDVLCGDRDF